MDGREETSQMISMVVHRCAFASGLIRLRCLDTLVCVCAQLEFAKNVVQTLVLLLTVGQYVGANSLGSMSLKLLQHELEVLMEEWLSTSVKTYTHHLLG